MGSEFRVWGIGYSYRVQYGAVYVGTHGEQQGRVSTETKDVDAVGAMFGLTPWLLQLWMREQTRPTCI